MEKISSDILRRSRRERTFATSRNTLGRVIKGGMGGGGGPPRTFVLLEEWGGTLTVSKGDSILRKQGRSRSRIRTKRFTSFSVFRSVSLDRVTSRPLGPAPR